MLKPAVTEREDLLLFINGEKYFYGDNQVFQTLSDFLRHTFGMVGTKIVCSEGDCGACSVLIGRQEMPGGPLVYRAYDSCILFMYQLDRTHVVTVEGLKRNGLLSPVQDAMVKHHGSQCGFCTPGFVTTMAGMLEDEGCERKEPLSRNELSYGLSGNLCRCTGYLQILDAGCAVDPAKTARLSDLYPDGPIVEAFEKLDGKDVLVNIFDREFAAIPASLESAVAFKARHPKCIVVAGATDIGVQHNKGKIDPSEVLCLTNVSEMKHIEHTDGVLSIGAAVNWTTIERYVRELIPQLHAVLTVFGSPQIRNAGTIGGNIANASPIADSLPFLFVTDTELELASPNGTRRVNINSFYHGYKKLDLKPDELIARVHVPLPTDSQTLRLYKVSRRRDLDISTFTAAVLMESDNATDTIRNIRIAYGGVAPVVLRLPKTEAFLTGKPFDEDIMREAGKLARTEITPITDVRGSADFRLQLAENILTKFYFECTDSISV